jgi:hypothetical protein
MIEILLEYKRLYEPNGGVARSRYHYTITKPTTVVSRAVWLVPF